VGEDRIDVVLDNIGLPYSGIDLSLGDSATEGPIDGEILVSLKSKHGPTPEHVPALRRTALELAWLWLRHQPDSPLARWFHERVGTRKGRLRKTMIVALARKLMIALWKFLAFGVVSEGAVVKS